MGTYDLEPRLIHFAAMILTVVESLPKRFGVKILSNQLTRSGISPALNYGEAQSAESPRDFLHKISLCLKELRETQICLRIIKQKSYIDIDVIDPVVKECGELVAIFTTSVETKKRICNQVKRQPKTSKCVIYIGYPLSHFTFILPTGRQAFYILT